jgi:F-type H+-transporting ATPase subunit epsilon
MADALAVEVLTPEQVLLAGSATAVILRTSEGTLTVLSGHAPVIGDVLPGEVRVEQDDSTVVRMAVHGGFVQVDTSAGAADGVAAAEHTSSPLPGLTTRVTVLAGIAELAEDIDVARAERARTDAQDRLEQARSASSASSARSDAESGTASSSANLELTEAEDSLRRAELRLKVAGAE